VRTVIDGVPSIRKQYRDDPGEGVHASMLALWSPPFGSSRTPAGLPQPLAYDVATRSLDMSVVEGAPLGVRGDVGHLPAHLHDVAALVADLHSSGVVVPRRRTPERLVRSLARKLPDDPRGLLPRIAVRAPQGERLCPNHGDFSPRNVVLTTAGPALIDFDRLQMAGPGRDVQYMAAWCWVTSVVNGYRDSSDAWALGDAFEAAYLDQRPGAAKDIHSGRTFHRACGLVRIATEWSSMKSDPAAAAVVLDQVEELLR